MAVAVVLPAVIAGVLNRNGYNISTSADQSGELRTWWEPAEVILIPGGEAELELNAEYERGRYPLPRLTVQLNSPNMTIEPQQLVYDLAFRGRITVGKIRIRVQEPGEYYLGVDENMIETGLTNIVSINSPAKVIVR